MENEFTHGPWRHVAVAGGWDGVESIKEGIICKLVLNVPANATLIAAVPDFYEVCKKLVEEQKYFEEHAMQPGMMPGNSFYSERFMIVVKMAQEAIKKAGG